MFILFCFTVSQPTLTPNFKKLLIKNVFVDEMAVQLNDSGSKLIFTINELMSAINKCSKILKKPFPTILAEVKPVIRPKNIILF